MEPHLKSGRLLFWWDGAILSFKFIPWFNNPNAFWNYNFENSLHLVSDQPYLETAVQIVSKGSRVEVVVQCGTFRLNIPKIEIWRQYKNFKSNNNLLLTNTFYPMNKCLNENLNLISNNTHSTECSLYWVAISFHFAFEKALVVLINILIY